MPSKYGFGNKRKSSPYNKNAKPDYPDIDGDGNRKESMKKAAADKKSPMNMNGDPKTGRMARKKAKPDPNINAETGKYYRKPGGAEGNKPSGKRLAKSAASPMNMNGDPKKANMRKEIRSKKATENVGGRGDMAAEARKKESPMNKYKKSPMNMMGKGPRYEGKRGKGTGYAN